MTNLNTKSANGDENECRANALTAFLLQLDDTNKNERIHNNLAIGCQQAHLVKFFTAKNYSSSARVATAGMRAFCNDEEITALGFLWDKNQKIFKPNLDQKLLDDGVYLVPLINADNQIFGLQFFTDPDAKPQLLTAATSATNDDIAPATSDEQQLGLTYAELARLQLPEREEVVFGLARGEVGTFNAITNSGKTTLLRNAMVCACTRREFEPLGKFELARRVAFLDFEDSLTFLKRDLSVMLERLPPECKARFDDNALLICDVRIGDEDLSLSNYAHLAQVTKRLQLFQPDLIIIDTISSAFSIRNENDNAEVRKFVMRPLRHLAKDCNAALIAAHHISGKNEDGATREAAHKGRGASSFGDLSRVVFNLERDSVKDAVVLSCAKIKGKKFTDTILKLDAEIRWFTVEGESRKVTNYELLLEMFDDHKPHSTKDAIAEMDGVLSERSVKTMLNDAVRRGDLEKTGHGIYRKCNSAITYRDCTIALSDNHQQKQQLSGDSEQSEKAVVALSESVKNAEFNVQANGNLFAVALPRPEPDFELGSEEPAATVICWCCGSEWSAETARCSNCDSELIPF